MKFGACTLHRAFSVPVGYCGPLAAGGAALLRLQNALKAAVLSVLDELSMVGRQMLGKVSLVWLCNITCSEGLQVKRVTEMRDRVWM